MEELKPIPLNEINKLLKFLKENDIDLDTQILDLFDLMYCWSCNDEIVQYTTKVIDGKKVVIHDDSQYCKNCMFYEFEPNMTEQDKINKSMHYRMIKYFERSNIKENHTLNGFYWMQNEIHVECKECEYTFIAIFEDHNADKIPIHCVFCGTKIDHERDIYNKAFEDCSCTCAIGEESDCYQHKSD